MSFRLFIYYCALCGGGGAFAGWALGRLVRVENPILWAGIIGLFLGLGVAFALGLVDALWVCSLRQIGAVLGRVFVAVVVGGGGGLVGGVLSQSLYEVKALNLFKVIGWTFTGLLIGLSLGVFDLLATIARGQESRGAMRKIRNGLLGGAVGGLLGGLLSVLLHGAWGGLFKEKPPDRLWSPSAWGFVALGLCIGLLIGLAQVFLKEAWLKVESGFRAGRELVLSKPEVTLGRAEGCDVGLFGDSAVDRLHARIVRHGDHYVLADAGSAAGTYVNGERVVQPRRLRSGDAIRLGRCVLRFGERRKK
jgi:hypothetical protein